jgi:hypothetical protein
MQIRRDHTAKIATGDRVRVHASAEAITAGVAGLAGDVIEVSNPSDPGVVVIGTKGEDQAVKVSFKEKEGVFWFAKNQLERINKPSSPSRAPQEVAAEPAPVEAKPKPWWKFGL